jgi:hypothetical protein
MIFDIPVKGTSIIKLPEECHKMKCLVVNCCHLVTNYDSPHVEEFLNQIKENNPMLKLFDGL